ncbi:Clp protease N-terminal domain-containing protein [Nonomuraea fuscirosea]|uniref:Clp protease N-terminal domain-containing protein n=1 Tax=Nonomuraea fuscirosea TaxID=1291556 RepID=UPI00341A7538
MAHAPAEARRRGDRRVGTEHLLRGVLHEAEAAQALGADVESARSALAVLDDAALAASA